MEGGYPPPYVVRISGQNPSASSGYKERGYRKFLSALELHPKILSAKALRSNFRVWIVLLSHIAVAYARYDLPTRKLRVGPRADFGTHPIPIVRQRRAIICKQRLVQLEGRLKSAKASHSLFLREEIEEDTGQVRAFACRELNWGGLSRSRTTTWFGSEVCS